MKVLIVCTGNTCRSPMAEGILKYLAKKNNIDIQVKSAGISAFDGDNISKNAILALRNIDLDISDYKSTLAHEELVNEADLILTMGKSHKEILINRFPSSKEKTFLLNEYSFEIHKDIEDPFGGNLREYERARDEIYKALEEIVRKIVNK